MMKIFIPNALSSRAERSADPGPIPERFRHGSRIGAATQLVRDDDKGEAKGSGRPSC